MESDEQKREFSEDNPFKKMNPEVAPALLWEKINDVEKVTVENRTDIRWLKREYAVQIALTGGVILLLLKFGGLI